MGRKTTKPQTAPKTEVQPDLSVDKPDLIVTADNGLNLRAGPHKDYAVITELPKGTGLRALESAVVPDEAGLQVLQNVMVPGWMWVACAQGSGWVDERYVEPASVSDPDTGDKDPEDEGDKDPKDESDKDD